MASTSPNAPNEGAPPSDKSPFDNFSDRLKGLISPSEDGQAARSPAADAAATLGAGPTGEATRLVDSKEPPTTAAPTESQADEKKPSESASEESDVEDLEKELEPLIKKVEAEKSDREEE